MPSIQYLHFLLLKKGKGITVIIHSTFSSKRSQKGFMLAIMGSKYMLDPGCLLRSWSITLPLSQQYGTFTVLFLSGQNVQSLESQGESSNFCVEVYLLCIKISKMIHSVNPISTHQQENKLRRHYIFL